jgi:CheY-like chemotaxis protein
MSGSGTDAAIPPEQSKGHSHLRILVVDDEKQIRQLNSSVLILSGYPVDTAEDGGVAWEALQAGRYGLLITDNQMPKITGVDLVKKCRGARMSLPVILASGAAPADAESLEIAAILLKPFTGAQLVKTVKEVLQGQLPNNTTRNLRQCARRILAHEARAARLTDATHSAVSRVWEQLRGPLSSLSGFGSYNTLVSRALVLAGAEVPWLRSLEIGADGSLKGLNERAGDLDSGTIAEGEALLVSQLLGLLSALVGPALTLTLLQTIWPGLDDLAL